MATESEIQTEQADQAIGTDTPAEPGASGEEPSPAEALVGRLFEAGLGSLELVNVYLGDRLGLYRALASDGPATPGDLAARAGIHERYAREWLEQQAVAGILDVDDVALPEDQRGYTLPEGHAEPLTDLDSPFSITPLARAVLSAAQAVPLVMEAFRTGGGVPWGAYGADMIESQGDFNRPWLVRALTTEYLPSIPDVHALLQADPPARVVEIASGVGWGAISIAKAYPKVAVDGFDLDETSVEIARKLAKDAGVSDRVGFDVRDGANLSGEGPYDLALVIEAIHDMSRPVEVLASIRGILAPGGSVIVADERVADVFTAPGDEVERFMYAVSTVVCLPGGLAEQPSAATGTVMRASTLRRYAEEAGFREVEILEGIQHDVLRFYRLHP
jgi:2-polyprenyl-3-methyl-5-hydroxy-6-metoxy-1,4-benzoquinol methylase